jgi:hypothetical protein
MLIEVGILCVVLSRPAESCSAGERVFRLNSGAAAVELVAARQPEIGFSTDLETVLARDFGSIGGISHVLVERADQNLLVWIALDSPSKEAREQVFQKELGLIDGFPEIDFDFNIIASRGRDPRQFASSAKVIYSREER